MQLCCLNSPRYRFGRDSFQEALKISNRVDTADIDWTRFRYMVFDMPNHKGMYQERYAALGLSSPPISSRDFKSHAQRMHSRQHLVNMCNLQNMRPAGELTTWRRSSKISLTKEGKESFYETHCPSTSQGDAQDSSNTRCVSCLRLKCDS